MSAYGLLASFGITTLIILQFLGYFLNIYDMASSLAMLSQAHTTSINRLDPSYVNASGNMVYLRIRNEGPVDISSKQIKAADLFLIYFNGEGTRKMRRLGYGETPGWQIVDVKLGESAEVLDPMRLSPELEGVWNVGETIYVTVTLEEDVNSSLPVVAKFWVVTGN